MHAPASAPRRDAAIASRYPLPPAPCDLRASDPRAASKEAGKIPAALNARLTEQAIRLACSKETLTYAAISRLLTAYPDTMARTPSNSAQAWPVTHCKASAIVIHPSVFRTSPEAFKQVLMPSAIVWHVIPRLMAGAFCCLARSPRKQTRQPPLAYLPCLV